MRELLDNYNRYLADIKTKEYEIKKDTEELEKQKKAIKGLLEAYQNIEVENSYKTNEV